MSNAIERVVHFDVSRTRAYMETPEGEYVCSNIEIAGDGEIPDSITLTGVGLTSHLLEAQMWIHLGLKPLRRFEDARP